MLRVPTTWAKECRVGWCIVALLVAIGICGCLTPRASGASIEITRVPSASAGGPDQLDLIEGRVAGAPPGQQIVLFARGAEKWWVQPIANQPFTAIHPDSTWRSWTHLGAAYAALLVEPG